MQSKNKPVKCERKKNDQFGSTAATHLVLISAGREVDFTYLRKESSEDRLHETYDFFLILVLGPPTDIFSASMLILLKF